jgi:hypothetical protein
MDPTTMLCHACNQTRHFQTVGPMWEKILEVMTDTPPPLKQVPNMGMVYGATVPIVLGAGGMWHPCVSSYCWHNLGL